MDRLGAPSDVEVKELASHFPCVAKKKKGFEPTAPVLPRKKCKSRKPKPVNVTVALLKKFSPIVPKGNVRQKLARQGRIQSLRLHREMTEREVRGKIASVFKCSQEFTVLDSDGSHTLCKRSDQAIDGAAALDHRCFYLCEIFEVHLILSSYIHG